MENNISRELVEKMIAAKSVLGFMFYPDATVQAFASGEPHELMVTIASEMKSGGMNLLMQ